MRAHKQHVHGVDTAKYGKCGKCEKVFKEGRFLETHESNCSGVQVGEGTQAQEASEGKSGFQCDVCMKVLSSKCAFYRHQRRVHNIIRPLTGTCTKCGKVFRYGEVLNRHQRNCRHTDNDHVDETVHTETHTACDRCDKIFRTKTGLKLHLNLVHGVGHYHVYTCKHCAQRFNSRNGLCSHEREVHAIGGAVTYACDVCGIQYKTTRLVKEHKARDHGIGTYQTHTCQLCQKVFFQKNNLKTHLSNVHSTQYKPHLDSVTTVTSTPYKRRSAVGRRSAIGRKVTTDIDPTDKSLVTCAICSRSFNKKTNLGRHLRTVHGDSTEPGTYQCGVCQAQFGKKRLLRSHMCTVSSQNTQSSDVQQEQCNICEETFSSHIGLIRHKRIHMEAQEKEVNCDVCHATFPTKTAMQRHKRTHILARRKLCIGPHGRTCAICFESYSCRSNLRKHQRTSHPDALLKHMVNTSADRKKTATACASVAAEPTSLNTDTNCDEKKPVIVRTWSMKPSPPHPGDPDEKVEILSDDDSNNTGTKQDWKPRIQSFASITSTATVSCPWIDTDVKQESSS